MFRKTPATFKPDADKVTALIAAVGLEGDLWFDERPRSLKFFKRYSGMTSGYGISRTEARNAILAAAALTEVTYDEIFETI